MEFWDVVRRRRMVRCYLDQPVDPMSLKRALDAANRAPSAGFTQGRAFLVIRRPVDVATFWEVTSPRGYPDTRNDWLDGMRSAPVVVVVLSSEAAYRERYSDADKLRATQRSAEMPWWQIDAAMAAMVFLQSATNDGLGACFFGIPAGNVASLKERFGIPVEFSPIGGITLGHASPQTSTHPAAGSAARRRRAALTHVAHDGHWDTPFPTP